MRWNVWWFPLRLCCFVSLRWFATLAGRSFSLQTVSQSALKFGGNQNAKTENVKKEHGRQQSVCARRRVFEFLPNEHPPQRTDQGCPLTQAIGEGGAGRAAGHDAESHAHIPNDAAQDADQMQARIALAEIVAEWNPVSHKGLDHDNTVP